MKRLSILLILLVDLVIALTAGADIYKWVDDEGNVHYGDCPPADCEPGKIEPAQGPSERDTQEAQERLERLRQRVDELQEQREDEIWPEEPNLAGKPRL